MSAPRIAVITATRVIDTGLLSFGFIAKGPFNDLIDIRNRYGCLLHRPYRPGEINVQSALQGGPSRTAETRLEMTICMERQVIYHCVQDYYPGAPIAPTDEPELKHNSFERYPGDGFVLLTAREVFDRVVKPSFGDLFPGASLEAYHYDGELKTG